jgi:hypothetical protein
MAPPVEFVRIAGYPVKVTSLARDHASGGVTLVVITRGSADRNHLNELLAATPLDFEMPGEPPRTVRVEGVDARSVGEGEQVISRFSIRLEPDDSAAHAAGVSASRSTEDRLEVIERKLDQVLEALASLRKNP